jgi:hypothetical protein
MAARQTGLPGAAMKRAVPKGGEGEHGEGQGNEDVTSKRPVSVFPFRCMLVFALF